MTKREVIDRILQYHPQLPDDGKSCDGYKYGNPDEECSGVASALVPTVEVIRRAGELGCNLLVVHEPTFYTSPDYPDWRGGFTNQVYEEKKKLLDQYGITIWRDHDHMHAHQPDSIFTGVIKYLGWKKYQVKLGCETLFSYCFRFEDMTVGKMADELKEKLKLNGLRYLGDPGKEIRTVALVGHLSPNAFGTDHQETEDYYHEYSTDVIRMLENGVDAIIPGEVIDWTVMSYIRDAVALGKNKAAFNIGHFSMEELGMKYAKDWIEELVDGIVPVHYIPSGDMYQFL